MLPPKNLKAATPLTGQFLLERKVVAIERFRCIIQNFDLLEPEIEGRTDRIPPHVPVPDAMTATKPVGWTWDERTDRMPPHVPVPDAIMTRNGQTDRWMEEQKQAFFL
ncbi:hypothetical protein AVEN_173204-1 [Araneus ventricosus]|uniref:Uncharacterized protein n=1 Tax=Araneus ventricosus TaxID=182803 RepID=A0A4Y2JHW4_ARAVE|nr:hypothetical protein AVEN_173204-1 [Araneus ventricosus]